MGHESRVAWILGCALLLFLGLSGYVYKRVASAFTLPKWSLRAYGTMLAIAPFCAILPRFFPGRVGSWAPYLGALAAMIVLSVLVSTALLWPYEVATGLVWVVQRFRAKNRHVSPESSEVSAAPVDGSRRTFMHRAAIGGAVSLGAGATVYGTLLGRHDYVLETVPIKLSKLPRELSGFRIVQLSDVHVGSFVGDYEMSRGLELVRRAKPDLIVMTGDLIDHDIRYVERLGRFARALDALAPHGVFAVMGNHDMYTGVRRVESVLTKAGTEVLTNRHVLIGQGPKSFVLAGLDDVAGAGLPGRGPNMARAFGDAPPDLARIVLSHNPGYYTASHPYADLTLSGHTHGGQISLFINPAQLILRHGFIRGHYSVGDSQLYVNRGFGTAGPPTRVGSQPEVTCLVLT
jgi:uncharacterized protein